MTTDRVTIAKHVCSKLSKDYDLPEDFVADLEKRLIEVLAPYYIYDFPVTPQPVKKVVKKKRNGPPKVTGYNLYVSENMSKVSEFPQNEKMIHLGKAWRNVSAEDRKPYDARAKELNEKAAAEHAAARG